MAAAPSGDRLPDKLARPASFDNNRLHNRLFLALT
jgi:hypothetical protein